MRLEQAIYTSVRSDRLDGYQLAAASAGVGAEWAQALSGWGPAHDSLWSAEPGASSVNFHSLRGERFCISRTTLSGAEYSGRGGGRVYTQMLVVPPESLERFAWDPFLILQAVEAAGRLVIYDLVPASLPAIPLPGRAGPPADLLLAIIEQVGAETIGEIAAALKAKPPVAVITDLPVQRLFQAVLHQLLPTERREVSFTTGLRPSPRRPLRLSFLPADPALVRQSQRRDGGRVIEAFSGVLLK